MFVNVMQTDSAEVLDLFTPKLIIYLSCASLLSFWILFKAPSLFQVYAKEFAQKALVGVLSLLIIAGLYMMVSKSYSSFFRITMSSKCTSTRLPHRLFSKFVYAKFKPKPEFRAIATDATRQRVRRKNWVVLCVR